LIKPLEFEQLNIALSRATSEIDTLGKRYEKLRSLVAERLSPLNSLQTGKPSQPSGNHVIPSSSSQAQASDTKQGLRHLGEISSLSEYEAKNILAVSS